MSYTRRSCKDFTVAHADLTACLLQDIRKASEALCYPNELHSFIEGMRALSAPDAPLQVWLALVYALDNPSWEPPSEDPTSKHRLHRYTLTPQASLLHVETHGDGASDASAAASSTSAGASTAVLRSESTMHACSEVTDFTADQSRFSQQEGNAGAEQRLSDTAEVRAPSHPLCAAVAYALLLDPAVAVTTDAAAAAEHAQRQRAALASAGDAQHDAEAPSAAVLIVAMLRALQGPQPMLHGEEPGLLRLLTLVRYAAPARGRNRLLPTSLLPGCGVDVISICPHLSLLLLPLSPTTAVAKLACTAHTYDEICLDTYLDLLTLVCS